MSRAPWSVPKPDRTFPRGEHVMYDTALGWRFVNPRMEELY
jgi:acetyl-CoA acyltransferase